MKIDGFLLKELTDEKNRAFFAAIIQIGKAIGARVVAECVETDSQLHILKSYGWLEEQGALAGKPAGDLPQQQNTD